MTLGKFIENKRKEGSPCCCVPRKNCVSASVGILFPFLTGNFTGLIFCPAPLRAYSFRFGGGLGNCHTFSKLVPAAKYGKEHPEWYSYRKKEGKRIGAKCLIHDALVDELRELFGDNNVVIK